MVLKLYGIGNWGVYCGGGMGATIARHPKI